MKIRCFLGQAKVQITFDTEDQKSLFEKNIASGIQTHLDQALEANASGLTTTYYLTQAVNMQKMSLSQLIRLGLQSKHAFIPLPSETSFFKTQIDDLAHLVTFCANKETRFELAPFHEDDEDHYPQFIKFLSGHFFARLRDERKDPNGDKTFNLKNFNFGFIDKSWQKKLETKLSTWAAYLIQDAWLDKKLSRLTLANNSAELLKEGKYDEAVKLIQNYTQSIRKPYFWNNLADVAKLAKQKQVEALEEEKYANKFSN